MPRWIKHTDILLPLLNVKTTFENIQKKEYCIKCIWYRRGTGSLNILLSNCRNRSVLSNGKEVHSLSFSYKRENKKLSYRRGTARCVVSVEILPTAAQQRRNYLYDKSWTNRSWSLSRGEFWRFWKYSNFRLCLILLLLLGPRVARCGEAANVKTARHMFCVDLVLRGCSC